MISLTPDIIAVEVRFAAVTVPSDDVSPTVAVIRSAADIVPVDSSLAALTVPAVDVSPPEPIIALLQLIANPVGS